MRPIDADALEPDAGLDDGEFWAYSIEQVDSAPTIEPEQRWIPCDERLPEENGVYVVSYEDAVTWLEWFNGKWFFYPSNPAREETGTILAWMPLPEPYREEGEKHE